MRKALLARPGLLVAAVANLTLAAMCILGSGGQTQTITVDVRGDSFQVRVDGIQTTPHPAAAQYASLEMPESGTISLSITPPIPSLPAPQGIDSVVVRDSDGGELFREDFDSLDAGTWQTAAGDFTIEEGVLVARRRAPTRWNSETAAGGTTCWRCAFVTAAKPRLP
jgi:hypothetical protein